MSNYDLDATVAYVDENAQPKGNFGCVYELWQQARNREAYALLGHVPDEHYDATVKALKAKGVIEEVGQPPEGLCQHWLDADTCPCGCFEGEEPGLYDLEDDDLDDLDAPEEPDPYLDNLPDVDDETEDFVHRSLEAGIDLTDPDLVTVTDDTGDKYVLSREDALAFERESATHESATVPERRWTTVCVVIGVVALAVAIVLLG